MILSAYRLSLPYYFYQLTPPQIRSCRCLDEPLNGIDIIARDQILETIQKYCSPTKTFLVSSHLVDDLERMTDDAIFMKNGGLVMCGKVDELTKHHGKTMTELYKEVYSDCVM